MVLTAYSVLNDYGKDAQQILESAGIKVTLAASTTRPNEEELISLVQKYDILIIGAREKMTKRVFDACTRTKIVGTLSVGVDHICPDFFNSNTIQVFNCPDSNTISVAEHTIGLILALKKRIIEGNDCTLRGSGRLGLTKKPRDLYGGTIGVIGAGRIGTAVIRMALAFHMRILCYTRNPQAHAKLLTFGVNFVDLDTLLSESDIITIHLPLTNETRMIIDARRINLMKDTAVFINTSRADLVDTPSLISRVDSCPGFSVGLDIDIDSYTTLFSKERRNLIVTPHIAGVSFDAILRMDTDLAQTIKKNIME